jgi:hypothetical protein
VQRFRERLLLIQDAWRTGLHVRSLQHRMLLRHFTRFEKSVISWNNNSQKFGSHVAGGSGGSGSGSGNGEPQVATMARQLHVAQSRLRGEQHRLISGCSSAISPRPSHVASPHPQALSHGTSARPDRDGASRGVGLTVSQPQPLQRTQLAVSPLPSAGPSAVHHSLATGREIQHSGLNC